MSLRDIEEKRDFMRMQMDCTAQCTDLRSGEQFNGQVKDLSGKGLCLELSRDLAPGLFISTCQVLLTNNIYWIGLDTTNAVACTEELVNFYQVVMGNNEGAYAWDDATLSWPSACTFAVTDLGTSFSVVATFPGITYQAGILVYSVDNGLTWNN